jgi:hypothetical protein
MKTGLKNTIRETSKRGNLVPALVMDVSKNRANVKITSNGALVRNLRVTGGPVYVGDMVNVDYTTPEPTVVSMGRTWVTEEELARALASIKNTSPKSGFTWRLLRFSGGYLAESYPFDGAGFEAAMLAAGEGDTIYVPPGELVAEAQILPVGACLSGLDIENSIVNAEISMSNRSKITNINISHQINDSETSIAVKGPSVGSAYIHNSLIMGFNCGSGDAIGIQPQGGTVEISDSHINGESMGGDGIAVDGAGGPRVKMYHCTYYGSTDDFTGLAGNVEVYSVTEGYTKIHCIDSVTPNVADWYNGYPTAVTDSWGLERTFPRETAYTATKIIPEGTSWGLPWAFSNNYLYAWTTANSLSKIDLKSGSIVDQVLVGYIHHDTTTETLGWVLQDENVGYALVFDQFKTLSTDMKVQLYKYDMAGSASTLLADDMPIYRIDGLYEGYSGYRLAIDENLNLILLEMKMQWHDETFVPRFQFRFRIWDTTLNDWKFQGDWTGVDPDSNNHLELSLDVTDWGEYPMRIHDGHCYMILGEAQRRDNNGDVIDDVYIDIMVADLDIEAETVTLNRWDWPTINCECRWMHDVAIDRANGILYFIPYVQGDFYRTISFNIGTSTFSEVYNTEDNANSIPHLIQGQIDVYSMLTERAVTDICTFFADASCTSDIFSISTDTYFADNWEGLNVLNDSVTPHEVIAWKKSDNSISRFSMADGTETNAAVTGISSPGKTAVWFFTHPNGLIVSLKGSGPTFYTDVYWVE